MGASIIVLIIIVALVMSAPYFCISVLEDDH
jgi:hypothetical protein